MGVQKSRKEQIMSMMSFNRANVPKRYTQKIYTKYRMDEPEMGGSCLLGTYSL
jgi:hypothetical protein